MAAKIEQREKRPGTRCARKAQPGITKKKLPWLDGRSSIASSSIVSSDGRASTPKQEGYVSPRPSHDLRGRLSVVHVEEPEVFVEARTRTDSLAPIPDHLERADSSDSIRRTVPRNVYASQPRVIKVVQRSPSQPVPRRSVFEQNGHRRLSNAIEGLEKLVENAVEAAEVTERPEYVEQIYTIIEDANTAVRKATVEPAQFPMSTPSPLQAASEEVLHVEQSTPEGIDWVHHNKNDHEHHHSLSMSSSSMSSFSRSCGRSQPRFSSARDHLQLFEPEPIATATREHVDHVLRPTISRSHSRGRPRRRTSGSADDYSRRRHRHHCHHDHGCCFEETRPRSSSSHQHDTSSDLIQFDSSHDEEGARGYGKELGSSNHLTLSLLRHRQQPIARNWGTRRKRISAFIACANTAILGIIIGIYAGEVPRMQYVLADENRRVIVGNVVLFFGLAITTFLFWPLPLLHGRKPYILASLALAMPLQFPQAMVLSHRRSPKDHRFLIGLLISRCCTGIVLGFANVNFISVLLDLFGASLQSTHPHQEFTVASDVRRHGGGMGMWLGLYSWCWIGSIASGFQIGAGIIDSLTPDWGFYVIIMILAGALVMNIMAPETRRSAYRHSVTEMYDRDENYITRRVARGEIKLHISPEGPKYWFEEVWAGLKLSTMMLCQPGFLVLAFYLGWIYTQIVLVIVLLGALLSRDYRWRSQYVGVGVMSIAIGALFGIPLTKAGIFSRDRKRPFRTDSMTFQKQVSWSSHLIRRCIFTTMLPLMGLAYTVSSAGRPTPFMVPIVFAGTMGFFSILAIAECHGLIMETFDTCDLQPGVNTRHRLQSMAVQDRRRRTNYSSFPRISAGIFTSQALSFVGAAIATEVGSVMMRRMGAQTSTGVTAGILFLLTVLLTLVLWRFKEVQVIPNYTFGTRRGTAAWQEFKELEKEGRGKEWKAVVIGNPSGKMRRMSVLELGALSRWTEIRKLNFLIRVDERSMKRHHWH